MCIRLSPRSDGSPLGYDLPDEAALTAAAGGKELCGVDIPRLVDAARRVLGLDETVGAPSELRVYASGSYNKVFLIRFGPITVIGRVPFDMPALRDPVRLRSRIATLQFLQLHMPDVPTPKLLSAVVDDTVAGAPFTIHSFYPGSPIGIKEWYSEMDFAKRDAATVRLAELWVKAAAPAPFKTLGSIVCEPLTITNGMWQREESNRAQPPRFRTMPMIPTRPDENTKLVDPSEERRTGPTTIAELWNAELERARQDIAATYPENATQANEEEDAEELRIEKLRRCVDALQKLIDVAAAVDPRDHPETALHHDDFACWRNVIFSEDRTHIEALLDWDDAVVVPRDLAATYPIELCESAAWKCDPNDVYEIPPGTLWENIGLWEEEIMETKQRIRFREVVKKLDPRLGAWYTDRRARFRRRVHYIATLPWPYWVWRTSWILEKGVEEARALAEEVHMSI